MVALIDIYNMALRHTGAPPLVSLEDRSSTRRDCDTAYAIARPALLRSHNWPFAIRRAVLTPLESPPAFGYRNVMRLPADCIKVIGASPHPDSGRTLLTGDPSTYRVEGQDLLTDFDKMFLVYIADVADPGLFDALFIEALSLAMAGHLMSFIGNDRQASFAFADRADVMFKRARRANSVEQPAEIPDTYGLFDTRGRYGRYAARDGVLHPFGPGSYTPQAEGVAPPLLLPPVLLSLPVITVS